jgi:signal transduction histidine kinase
MNLFASEITDAKNIQLEFKSEEALSNTRLTIKQRKNLYLFFKETINNAGKHSGAMYGRSQPSQKNRCCFL